MAWENSRHLATPPLVFPQQCLRKVLLRSFHLSGCTYSLRKQPTFGDATTGFPAKWRLRNERRNFILMTRQCPDLGSVSDWLNQISHPARPIRSTSQIWLVTRHQYGISALVSQTSFGVETSGSVAKCRLFYQAISATIQVKATEQYFPVTLFIIYGGGSFKNSLCYLKKA